MRMNRRALLVVDVQRDFCPGGALPAPTGDRIVPAINAHMREALERRMPMYASRDWHPAMTSHFKPYGGEWPPHCVQGTSGADFHPDLRLPCGAIVISKGDDPRQQGYSTFDGHTSDGERLLDHLRRNRIVALSICGIATDYCVKQTTIDARRAGLEVSVLTDAIAGVEVHAGDVNRALSEMAGARAALTTVLRPTDVLLLSAEARSRVALRAQLIEEGFEVAATDEWPMARHFLRPGAKPQFAFVDVRELRDATRVLDELPVLMSPERVLILTALGSIAADDVTRRGFHVRSRPISIDDIVDAIATCLRAAASADAQPARGAGR
jgi:nicotinamidase/pyrazinamidase